jgi:hypothetical protein
MLAGRVLADGAGEDVGLGDANSMWWGGHFGDNDHWQNRRTEPPQHFGTLKQINDALAAKWTTLI